MEEKPTLGVIGGSGLYSMPGLEDLEEIVLETPFGRPSAPLVSGKLDGKRVIFLARHGVGHSISPTEVNYRANIYALKAIGVERVISISACGSLRENIPPGDFVIPGGLFDFTRDRKRSFFEDGLVAHIGVADPFCPQLSSSLVTAARNTGAKIHEGGTFITIEGPRFSTKSESHLYRSWGMSIIGMTTSPEAFLAREAELCYAVLAHVTDYDVWHVSEEPVSVQQVIQVLHQNTHLAQNAIHNLVKELNQERTCSCGQALSTALITDAKMISEETRRKLSLLVDKYMK